MLWIRTGGSRARGSANMESRKSFAHAERMFLLFSRILRGKKALTFIHSSQPLIMLLLLIIAMFTSCEFNGGRRRIADNFLEALKTKKLTAANAIQVYKKYNVSILALSKDIYFPIALLDYQFLSEEAIPRGLVTHSLNEMLETMVKPSPLRATSADWIQSDKEGLVFVIKGMVPSYEVKARSSILIRATALDENGRLIKTKTVYAGNTFTEEQIKEMSIKEIDRGLSNEFKTRSTQSGKPIPFMIVFGQLARNIGDFKVEFVPDEEKIKVVKRLFNSLKKELKAKQPRDLKIDDENKIITYYDDTPGSFKLHYRLLVTNRVGMTLTKDGYVKIRKGLDNKNEIVEFKW
ncbi:MAG: hypothetical protein JRJ66_02900 [Deltaproteobacteria bacterium]|nr:hypothetical protein [Deltaproteobacteria bacterium]